MQYLAVSVLHIDSGTANSVRNAANSGRDITIYPCAIFSPTVSKRCFTSTRKSLAACARCSLAPAS